MAKTKPRAKVDTRNVQTWITEEAHEALAAAAASSTRSISSWVRRTIYEKLGIAEVEANGDVE
jgi:predicted HicB family RNase H-like nuclease